MKTSMKLVELCRRLLARHHAFVVFGLIGVVNTFLHSGAVIALVETGLAKEEEKAAKAAEKAAEDAAVKAKQQAQEEETRRRKEEERARREAQRKAQEEERQRKEEERRKRLAEEKEREAERLFVLFERLRATGVVDIKNPVQQAIDEGRFEELD